MSEYGRLWQLVADIRREIRSALPTSNTDTLAKATSSVEAAGKLGELGYLLSEWASLERKMERTDD